MSRIPDLTDINFEKNFTICSFNVLYYTLGKPPEKKRIFNDKFLMQISVAPNYPT